MDERIRMIGERVRRWLEERYGSAVNTVILYGSHARGTATEDSDVDLLVVVEESLAPQEVRRSLNDLLFDILIETGELVSAVVVPRGHYEHYRSPFLINVRREGIRL